jgi:sortase A
MTTSAPPRARSPWTWRIGLVLLLAGVAVLGFVGWQYWVTNWVSERHHREIVSQLEHTWDTGHGQGQGQVVVGDSRAGAVVRIPRFGDDYEVPMIEGTSDDALASGIGHVEGTAEPGEVGNLVLAAHRVTHGEPFSEMPDLRPGDTVVVETADTVYTYALDTGGDDLVVSFTDTWVTDPVPTNPESGGPQPDQSPGQRLITLTTCAELFHTDDRMVAFGHLVDASPRTD